MYINSCGSAPELTPGDFLSVFSWLDRHLSRCGLTARLWHYRYLNVRDGLMKRIYLVEDNTEISELLSYILNEMGFLVLTSTTISDFKRHFHEAVPDLIILDVMLPDGNGIDLCEQLKSDPVTSQVRVLLMSAHVHVKTRALEAADAFIAKPFDLEEFTGKIRHLTD